MSGVLTRLEAEIASRKEADPESSYTASLFHGGDDAILKKVGEEAVEFILAAKEDDKDHLIAEAADVWFHMLVMMSAKGLGASDILSELQRREGVSGHVEKASRSETRKLEN